MSLTLSGSGTIGGLVSGGLPDGTVLPADLSTGGPYWDTSGNLLVGKTSATANGGDVQVSKGITFPATQVACSDANTLDDYEEGTWTPTPVCTYGSITYSSVSSSGTYVKIGKTVYCWFKVYFIASSNSGNTGMSGLPFTISTLSGGLEMAGTAREDSSSGLLYQVEGFTNGNSSFQVLRRYDNGSILSGVNAFGGTFMYQTT